MALGSHRGVGEALEDPVVAMPVKRQRAQGSNRDIC